MSERTKLPRLPNLVWTQAIRDPVWDEIPITEVEKRIISTEAFYRLRGIKQLSFAYLAFPGAVHSRFEHSLGAMHATDMLLKMVRSQEEENGIEISSFDRQLLRLAALLHDIGHPPFSHVMENFFSHYPDILSNRKAELPKPLNLFLKERGLKLDALTKHEFFTEYIVCQNEDIRKVIREWIEVAVELPKDYTPKYTDTIINPKYTDTIINLIAQLGSARPFIVKSPELPDSIPPLIRIFKSIMSGDIDADKIDYLMRDNYYCGLPHRLDLTSLRNHLILQPDGLEIQPEARGFVHSLILARYRLITEVHQDMWGVYATAKVIELLHNLLVKEPKPVQLMLDIFTKWDDSKLLDYLIKSGDPTIKPLLTTQYPLHEVARLDNIDTHPYVRECIQVLSEICITTTYPSCKRICARQLEMAAFLFTFTA